MTLATKYGPLGCTTLRGKALVSPSAKNICSWTLRTNVKGPYSNIF